MEGTEAKIILQNCILKWDCPNTQPMKFNKIVEKIVSILDSFNFLVFDIIIEKVEQNLS